MTQDNVTGSMGGGGGGGGASHTPVEAPNTLRSKAYGVVMDIISEGPIQGLLLGPQGIRLNDTPIMGPDGQTAFKGIAFAMQNGYPNQSPIVGFPYNNPSDAGYVTTVNTQVKNTAPGAITRAVVDSAATSVLITLSVPQLFKVDTANGDTNPYSIAFTIATRGRVTDAFSTVVTDTIAGKCTSTYQRQYRLTRPDGNGTWEIKITKTSTDSTSASTVDGLFWDSISVVYDNLMTYPNTAYAMMQFDAQLFGSSIPTRKYEVMGRLIQIPNNYDPINRIYTGIWDGTFQTFWSNNPAWVWYDLVTNDWFGAGQVIDPATVDKWSLYAIGQYCDQLLPDGAGGFEPRFTFNGVLDRPDDGLKVLAQIAAMFDSVVYANASTVTLVQDNNTAPTRLVTQANVINGEFVYQGTAQSTRPTAIRSLFIDPLDQWKPSVEPVEYPDLVARWGYQPQDIQLIGCTSRGQAARKGLNTIDLAWTSGEIVVFSAGLDLADILPGETILVSDPLYAGIRIGGRCLAGSTTSALIIDAPIALYGGQTYVVYITYPDGTVDFRHVANASDNANHTVLNPTVPFAQAPHPEAVWLVAASNLEPRPFRVITVAEKTATTIEVSAVFYDVTRKPRVELGIRQKPPIFSILPDFTAPLPPPYGMTSEENLTGVGSTTIIRVMLSWSYANDPRIGSFQVEAINSAGASTSYTTAHNTLTIDGLPRDTFTFRARSVSLKGDLVSAWCTSSPVNVDGVSDPPSTPLGLTAKGGIHTVQLSWADNPERDIDHYEVQRAPDAAGTPGSFSPLARVSANGYVDANADVLLPTSKWWYRVSATTTTKAQSPFTSPVLATISEMIAADIQDGIIDTAKFAASIKPVNLIDTLGAPGVQDDIAFNTGDGHLYKYNSGVWVPLVDTAGITGTVTDAQIASVAASKITGQLTNAQIASLAAAKLSGTVIASQIAAGAVTTEQLSVGSASNVVWNSCLEQAPDGWNWGTQAGGTYGTTKGTGYDPTWRLTGYGSGYVYAGTNLTVNGTVLVAAWDPNYGDASNPLGVAFPPNTPIEAQAQMMMHRCAGRVQIDFYNAAGGYVSSLYGSRVVTPAPVDGKTLTTASYKQSWAHGISPATCARARLVLYGFNDGGGDIPAQTSPPYMFFTQTAIGAGVPNATQPQAWQPGGLTSLTGSLLKTASIQTAQLAAGSVKAGIIAAGGVVAGNVQALSVSSNELAANSVILGKVAAGAINAAQINAGQIRATHLASETILTQAAQIGFGLINTAHIGTLIVDTPWVANSAITNVTWNAGWQTQDTALWVTLTENVPVVIWCSGGAGFYNQPSGDSFILNQGTIYLQRYSQPTGHYTNLTGNTLYPIYIDWPGPGNHSYIVHIDPQPGFTWGQWAQFTALNTILAMVLKR